MSRITSKGQVTIPKKIRDDYDIKENDIGIFTIEEGRILFTVKRGTLLDAHRKKSHKTKDFKQIRKIMEKDIALNVLKEIE